MKANQTHKHTLVYHSLWLFANNVLFLIWNKLITNYKFKTPVIFNKGWNNHGSSILVVSAQTCNLETVCSNPGGSWHETKCQISHVIQFAMTSRFTSQVNPLTKRAPVGMDLALFCTFFYCQKLIKSYVRLHYPALKAVVTGNVTLQFQCQLNMLNIHALKCMHHVI